MLITVFYITAGDEASAQSLGRLAVEEKLAGCSNIFPMTSFFPWDNAMQQENEFVIILKTIPALADQLRSFVAVRHPYEIPCIIDWQVNVNDAYGKWIEDNVRFNSA